jgi:hypothetical protein
MTRRYAECIDCGVNRLTDFVGGIPIYLRCKSCAKKKENHSQWRGGYSRTEYANHKLFMVYCSMIYRCRNPHNKDYKDYGGRGIAVCDEWGNDFLVFEDWALSHGYNELLSIHRIDNNKGYEPNNCEWITINENVINRNKENSKKVSAKIPRDIKGRFCK